jgi:hypothetical protein
MVSERRSSPGKPAVAAIFAAIAVFEAQDRIAALEVLKAAARPFPIFGMQQIEDRHAVGSVRR